MVKVSVIVPVYNAEKALERCIDSILNQEYKDLELIAVDDGSKDHSGEILDTYAKADPRVVVIHKENGGVSDTRNRALDIAQGEYVQFLDADDWIPADSTKVMVRAIEESGADLVTADFYRVVGNNIARKGSITTSEVLTRQEYAEWMMDSPADYYYGVLWNKLYRRQIIEQYHLRMDKTLSFCEDFVYNLEYILRCKTIIPLQIPVYYYVKTDGSLVSQNMNFSRIVQMKTSIYEYYNAFFKQVLDKKEYSQERINIARFLVSAATDDMAIPLLPGTRKLGEEKVQILYNADKSRDPVSAAYYMNKVFDRLLNSVAMKHDLDLRDVRVFYALHEAGRIFSPRELSDFTGISQTMILLSLQKLASRSLAVFRVDLSGIEFSVSDSASDLIKDIGQAKSDLYAVMQQGLTEEEIRNARITDDKILTNLKNSLETYEA
ncbi:MAG: glycosyltransferase [Solobacterium sp.]|nr:glycosyltransferase [Solobacterium sp.]